MNHGPLIAAGAFVSLAFSWAALVMAPQVQLGSLAPAPIPNTSDVHPANRPGLAAQGAEVYRSLGCYQCHTRQVRQDALLYGARLVDRGSNASTINLELPGSGRTNLVNFNLLIALAKSRADLGITPVAVPPVLAADTNLAPVLKEFATELKLLKQFDDKARIVRSTSKTVNELAATLPVEVLERTGPDEAERAVKLINDAGGKAELVIYNLGPDIERGWGARRSVARDFVNDSPVLLGSLRVGPDLACLGSRAPEKFAAPWKPASTNLTAEIEQRLLDHLYNPRLVAPASTCPSAKYLFATKQPEQRFAGEPLQVPGSDKPVYPRHEARALVAYLLDQRLDVGLPEAPVTKSAAPAKVAAAPAKP
jgi:cbb3-type cytochrome oxidase cytochrome c subunit